LHCTRIVDVAKLLQLWALTDGDGNLVKKINPGGSKTLYVAGIYIIPFGDEVDKNSGGTVTGTKTYYPAAGAMRVGSAPDPVQLCYL
jgi:hypothetical protein